MTGLMLELPQPTHLRLFVGLPVSEEVKSAVEKAQAELRRAAHKASIRWATRNQFHLTLRFLGAVERTQVEALTESLRGAAAGFGPLQMRAQGVGFFPDARYPRVVWVGLEDAAGRLEALRQAVQTATAQFTEEKAEERFVAHLTLGRVKSIKRHESEALAQTAGDMAARDFGHWTASELELVRSQLASQGSVYTSLAVFPLA